MIKPLFARLQQKHRTIRFPKTEPELPERFCGKPTIDQTKCPMDCKLCIDLCPTMALKKEDDALTIDLGRCLFCGQCAQNCPADAINFSRDYRLAARAKSDLVISEHEMKLAEALDKNTKSLFGRSLKLRQVSAGGCNACEADINVLNTVVFDLGRFGIQFVASPRHADGLLITGPVTENMRLALKKTYDAVLDPKIVIAVGACAISGGIYVDHHYVNNGADKIIPVDLYIPGCPPHPLTILDGLLRLLGKTKK
ncbi:MAG: NADH-quinone oxidoreductase subunit NuoB [Phycisphaerae bacterium]|jgi:Ni,Fe-hydrogenase III small subunit/Pyruvate/2-oxoacid:ferredoxin oxidoreductase delta subunit